MGLLAVLEIGGDCITLALGGLGQKAAPTSGCGISSRVCEAPRAARPQKPPWQGGPGLRLPPRLSSTAPLHSALPLGPSLGDPPSVTVCLWSHS